MERKRCKVCKLGENFSEYPFPLCRKPGEDGHISANNDCDVYSLKYRELEPIIIPENVIKEISFSTSEQIGEFLRMVVLK